jgi:hypothetical protein
MSIATLAIFALVYAPRQEPGLDAKALAGPIVVVGPMAPGPGFDSHWFAIQDLSNARKTNNFSELKKVFEATDAKKVPIWRIAKTETGTVIWHRDTREIARIEAQLHLIKSLSKTNVGHVRTVTSKDIPQDILDFFAANFADRTRSTDPLTVSSEAIFTVTPVMKFDYEFEGKKKVADANATSNPEATGIGENLPNVLVKSNQKKGKQHSNTYVGDRSRFYSNVFVDPKCTLTQQHKLTTEASNVILGVLLKLEAEYSKTEQELLSEMGPNAFGKFYGNELTTPKDLEKMNQDKIKEGYYGSGFSNIPGHEMESVERAKARYSGNALAINFKVVREKTAQFSRVSTRSIELTNPFKN